MATRRISVNDLRVGMFVTGTDRSWIWSPFFRRQFLIQSQAEIDKLRGGRIREVVIDLARGADVASIEEGGGGSDREVDSDSGGLPAAPSLDAPKNLEAMAKNYRVAMAARQKLEQTVHCLFDNISATGMVNAEEAHEAAQEIAIVTRTLTNPALFAVMSQARDNGKVLGNHAMSTCTFAMILGQAVGLNLMALQDLAIGALLHDLGLVKVPPSLLDRAYNSSRPLTGKEQAIYEGHGKRGAVEVERQGTFSLDVRRIIAEHHVYLNQTGFPSDLHPQWTTTSSRIVMIADQYDELISGFGGRTPIPPHEALQQLYRASKEGALDPELTALFIKRVGVFPIYSTVQLNTGERGVIADLNPDHLHLPVIVVTHSAHGDALSAPLRVDLLNQDPGGVTRSIARVLKAASALPTCDVEPAHSQ